MRTRHVTGTEINPVVSLSQWHTQYPLVDREYIWIYPLLRNEPFDPSQILRDPKVPLLSLDTVVYIHVPACLFRCPMCPFYLEIIGGREDLKGYADTVISELELYAKSPIVDGLNLQAIYFGGGTATLLYPTDIGRIIQRVLELVPSSADVEITVEGHPHLVDYDYLSALYDQGVNRVSFGIQSFREEPLQILGLKQTPESNRRTLRDAIKLGFHAIAIDLLYRIPGQSVKDVELELIEAINLGVNSISAYSLELSVRQSALRNRQPDEATDREMFYLINDILTDKGWNHVAQPDYSAPRHTSQEIIITWKAPQGQWFSLGAGAWSAFNGTIYCNVHDIEEYKHVVGEGCLPILAGQAYSLEDAMSRYAVLGARCFDIPSSPFREAFGVDFPEVFDPEVRILESQGLIAPMDDGIRVTRKGKYYIGNISKTFYSLANRCHLQPWGARMQGTVAPTYHKVGNFVGRDHK